MKPKGTTIPMHSLNTNVALRRAHFFAIFCLIWIEKHCNIYMLNMQTHFMICAIVSLGLVIKGKVALLMSSHTCRLIFHSINQFHSNYHFHFP